ncbi:ferritin-like domain-containing protein [Occallatibacter savannae]|uniref:YciE/YciF ferroxidase family protein n=1 Tax=Occallatibacter savannae TaxID=1002691 RepID=UPI000D686760|nr:ferritin-like domain-containing protein [Occallatibacter savannae]
MSVGTAEELFVDELKDIYSAEKQAVKAYPRLTKAVQSEELKQAMQEHLEQTKGQIERLDRIFEILEKRSSGKTCEGMKGLIEEAQTQLEEIEKGPVLDCAIIGALQRVEHYEIAAYGTVATLAEAMGQEEVKELLGETLEEEKETDERLTQVAQQVNSEALSEGGEEEEGSEDEDENESGGNGSRRGAGSRSTAKKSSSSRSGSSRSGSSRAKKSSR